MALTGNKLTNPPDTEQIEVSIFGPGFGECIVVHFGQGAWGIIDSCLNPASKRPIALDYLQSLHIDIAKAVGLVVGTHWHDDHMQGIGAVFEAAESAVFVCNGALRSPDFKQVMAAWIGTRPLSGVEELGRILSRIKKRGTGSRFPSPKLASADKILWERLSGVPVRVKALSPSDATVIAAFSRIKGVIPDAVKARRRLPNIAPNDTSTVISVQIGEHQILLGADLEVTKDRSLGWLAIVDGVDQEKASKHHVFKVPHHGSPTGHHDEVWDKMLVSQPWCVIAPFCAGSVNLPSRDDCQRILRYTNRAYLTASPHPNRFRDTNRAVEKTVTEATLSAHFIPGKFGHVRLRKHVAQPHESVWNVELFGDAIPLQDYMAV